MVLDLFGFVVVMCWALAPQTVFAMLRLLILLYALGIAPGG